MLTPCACGGRHFWRVFPYRQPRAFLAHAELPVAIEPPAPIAQPPWETKKSNDERPPIKWWPPQAYGRLEVHICHDCRDARFFAREFEPDEWLNLGERDDEQLPSACLSCFGQDFWFEARVRKWRHDGETALFSDNVSIYAVICRHCKRFHWLWRNRPMPPRNDSPLACPLCNQSSAIRLDEIEHVDLPVAIRPHLIGHSTIGRLTVELCRVCAHVRFRAQTDALAVDPDAGLSRIEVMVSTDSGPYRS
jgi:hypothetical protein